jgi:hypothetical protein
MRMPTCTSRSCCRRSKWSKKQASIVKMACVVSMWACTVCFIQEIVVRLSCLDSRATLPCAGVHKRKRVPRVRAEAAAVVRDHDFMLCELTYAAGHALSNITNDKEACAMRPCNMQRTIMQHAHVELGHAHLHDLLLRARRYEPASHHS